MISTYHQNHHLHFIGDSRVNRDFFISLRCRSAYFCRACRIISGGLYALLAVLIGFFVAAASGYMAGLVGSSSSPISGIGIISVIVISLVLVTIGKSSGLFETADGQNS